MIKVAGRGVVLSFITLIVTFFYIQPEVGEAFNLANNSQNETTNELTNETNNTGAAVETAEETTNNKTSEIATTSGEKNAEKILSSVAFSATAYCLKGRTASGSGVRRGIIAADPRILPLGTKVYMNAGPYSGTYLVADTGGAVKGRKIDVWVPSQSEAIRFGRRKVSIKVLGK